MEKHYKEMLRFQLMEEIDRINARVTALGTPRDTMERSLIARYGKLLFVSQQLMDTLPKLPVITDANPVIPRPERRSFSRRFSLV